MLCAVHISDGVLLAPWLLAGGVLAFILVSIGLFRFELGMIPRIGLLAAVFFVSSQIHFRMGPTSVHLLLNGLVGIMLGRFAGIAILEGLFLQCMLFNHGGWTTLGVNTVVLTLPALLAYGISRVIPLNAWTGSMIGFSCATLTVLLNFLVLLFGGSDDWPILARLVVIPHLPIIVLEAILLGVIVGYLQRVKPELLQITKSHQ